MDRRVRAGLGMTVVATLVAVGSLTHGGASAPRTAAATAASPGSALPIAYAVNVGGEESVAVMGADGRGFGVVMRSAGDPEWSPDGSLLAVSERRGEDSDIAVVSAGGSAPRRLTSGPGADVHPVFSPDGRRIAFSRGSAPADGPTRAAIHVADVDGSRLGRITPGRHIDTDPDWSPDGRLLAFTRSGVRRGSFFAFVVIRDLERGAERRLVAGSEPAFSPDGRRIAYVSRRDRSGRTCFAECVRSGEIHVVGLDGRGDVRLTSSRADDGAPAWVAGGRQLLFASDRAAPARHDYELYAMSDRGACVTRLTNSSAWPRHPAWNPAAALRAACAPGGVAAGARKPRGHVDIGSWRASSPYTVFWLGRGYRGLLLSHAARTNGRIADSFELIYGDCGRIRGGCPAEVQVQNRPLCWWKGEPARPQLRRIGRLRGAPVHALARRHGDRGWLEVHTGGTAVRVLSDSRRSVWRALARLRPIDGDVGRLPPPAQTCS